MEGKREKERKKKGKGELRWKEEGKERNTYGKMVEKMKTINKQTGKKGKAGKKKK